jgi:hypothetical protein
MMMDAIDLERLYPETAELLTYIAQDGEDGGVKKYFLRRPGVADALVSEMDAIKALEPFPVKALQNLASTWLADEALAKRWFSDLYSALAPHLKKA